MSRWMTLSLLKKASLSSAGPAARAGADAISGAKRQRIQAIRGIGSLPVFALPRISSLNRSRSPGFRCTLHAARSETYSNATKYLTHLDLVGEDGDVHGRHGGVLGELFDIIGGRASLQDQSFRLKNNAQVADAAPQPVRQQSLEPLLG